MPEWNQQNQAHWGTYLALTELGELNPAVYPFPSVPDLTMPVLDFWIWGQEAENAERAPMLAQQIFNFIVYYYRPLWQAVDITTHKQARDRLVEVLIGEQKTIRELAELVDEMFKFSNEQ